MFWVHIGMDHVCCLLTFFKINLFKKFFQEHYQSVKQFKSDYPDQDRLKVCSELDPNCLQRLSADTSRMMTHQHKSHTDVQAGNPQLQTWVQTIFKMTKVTASKKRVSSLPLTLNFLKYFFEMVKILICRQELCKGEQWLSGRECLTQDRGVAGSSLTGVPELCP